MKKLIVGLAALAAVLVVVALCVFNTQEQRAARTINSFANHEALRVYGGTRMVGPRESHFADETITAKERADAAKLVKALCQKDLPAFQAVLDEYEGQYLSLVHTTHVASVCLQMAKSPIRLSTWQDHVAIDWKDTVDGCLTVTLSSGKAPIVSSWHKEEWGGFSAKEESSPTPQAVFGQLGDAIVNSVTEGSAK